jgi:uncharacterized membrane protein YkoI
MSRSLIAVAVMAAALTGTPLSIAGDQGTAKAPSSTGSQKAAPHVDLSKYPAAVRSTIEAETRNATLKGVSKETEHGKVQYEVETLVGGKSRDLLVDPSGKVIEVEEEVAIDSAPAAVQAALNARGKVLKLERVTRGSTTSYEASVSSKNGKKSSVALDADGKPAKG